MESGESVLIHVLSVGRLLSVSEKLSNWSRFPANREDVKADKACSKYVDISFNKDVSMVSDGRGSDRMCTRWESFSCPNLETLDVGAL